MQTSRREILDDFLSFVGAAGDAKARDRAERLLNRVLEKIWMLRGWRCFIDPTVWEFSTVANTRAYALPDHFGRISGNNRTLRNLTNGSVIHPWDRSDLEEVDPLIGTTLEQPGCPTRYQIAGTSPVQTQPSSAGEALEVLSSSLSDTTVRAYIEGLTTSNLVAQAQVTVNGVTPVPIGTWSRILKFGKSYPAATTPTTELTSSEGTVTLRKVSGATELQVLAPWQAAREHQTIVLAPVPNGVYTIGLPILRAIERAYLDGDPLPPQWTNAVFDGMTMGWRVSDDGGFDSVGMWPTLVDLVSNDNAQAAQARRHKTPYTG
jgi:hypothetical protein